MKSDTTNRLYFLRDRESDSLGLRETKAFMRSVHERMGTIEPRPLPEPPACCADEQSRGRRACCFPWSENHA